MTATAPSAEAPKTAAAAPPVARWSLPALLIGLAMLWILASRVTSTYPVFNGVVDEPAHIISGLEMHQFGGNSFDYEHPPLARLLIGLGPYLGGVRLAPVDSGRGSSQLGVVQNYWKALALGRLGTLAFAPVLVLYVYLWSSALFGRRAGVAATALATFCPNLIAHAGLATVDFAAAITIFAASFHLWRWLSGPSWRRCCLAGLACGTAVLSKFSAFVFLPPIGLAFLVLAGIRVRPARRAAGQAAMFAAVALAVIWAVYSLAGTKGRRFEDMAESGLQFAGSAHAAKPFRPDARVYGLLHALPILPGPMRAGLVVLAAHARTGHAAYLLGENSSGGWWYYFPVALAVKASLPLLLLLPVAVAALMGQGSRGNGREALYPAAGAVAILATAMAAPINIGIRHALPLFPFLAVAASAACAEGQRRGWRRAIPVVGLVLLLWHGVESARAHPDYLAYFNSIARGREEQFLGDSNLDWGQDLARLGRYVKAAQIEKIHISYFGSARAEFLGIPGAVEFGPQDRPSGWVAISISHTQRISVKGAVPEPGYRWLASYRPYARIGKSILLYRLP